VKKFNWTIKFDRMKAVGAIDLGTTSQRFIIFDEKLRHVATHQTDYTQISLNPGWTEQDPMEVLNVTIDCMKKALHSARNIHPELTISCLGITNQRETTLVWDKETGKPLHNAIVWHDTRTKDLVEKIIAKCGDKDVLRSKCGLPISTYFSALKLKWIIENVFQSL
jgi:glycerol kinase